ncbi:MAG TPA: hypothetical protein PKG48_14190 [Bacteroidales bacterium]|nr:hypothetical protein [Bacteroidales bacterium]HPS61600.1 hypothetical protein [Bacteroidales bacterium]
MNKVLITLFFMLAGIVAFSQPIQPDKVPQNIKERLQFKFPQAMDVPVSWSKEKNNYKATLTIMDEPAVMVMDTTGKSLRIERRIHDTYLPKKAKDYLKSLDKNFEVISVTQITEGDELYEGKEKVKVTYKTVAKIKSNFTFDTNGDLKSNK